MSLTATTHVQQGLGFRSVRYIAALRETWLCVLDPDMAWLSFDLQGTCCFVDMGGRFISTPQELDIALQQRPSPSQHGSEPQLFAFDHLHAWTGLIFAPAVLEFIIDKRSKLQSSVRCYSKH